MMVAAGKSVVVDWGDGNTNTYTAGAGTRTHAYAGVGANEKVLVGEQRTYLTKTYTCIQPHVTEFNPLLTPALWKLYVDPATPQPWVQPTGAHDAYALGAKVTYGGFTWQSTVAANVWAPGTTGSLWMKV